jgi:hypothetical protein
LAGWRGKRRKKNGGKILTGKNGGKFWPEETSEYGKRPVRKPAPDQSPPGEIGRGLFVFACRAFDKDMGGLLWNAPLFTDRLRISPMFAERLRLACARRMDPARGRGPRTRIAQAGRGRDREGKPSKTMRTAWKTT